MMLTSGVVEISSDEESPTKKKSKICKEESTRSPQQSSSQKIEIRIEQGARRATAAAITIVLEEPERDLLVPRAGPGSTADEDDFPDFVQLCRMLDRSPDMTTVVETKLQRYYGRADPAYVASPTFRDFIVRKKNQLRADSSNLWVHIKDVVDTLKAHRKSEFNTAKQVNGQASEEAESRVQALEKEVETLGRLIGAAEREEVVWEDEEHSSYIRADRYKARLLRAYRELRVARGGGGEVGAGRVRVEGGGAAARLEAWVNGPVVRGLPPRFPDYHDVLACVRAAAPAPPSHTHAHAQARSLFGAAGRALQAARRGRDARLWAALVSHPAPDPADSDPALRETLQRNAALATHNEETVFRRFLQKEKLLNASRRVPSPSERVAECEESEPGRGGERASAGAGDGAGLVTSRRASSASSVSCALVTDCDSVSSHERDDRSEHASSRSDTPPLLECDVESVDSPPRPRALAPGDSSDECVLVDS